MARVRRKRDRWLWFFVVMGEQDLSIPAMRDLLNFFHAKKKKWDNRLYKEIQQYQNLQWPYLNEI